MMSDKFVRNTRKRKALKWKERNLDLMSFSGQTAKKTLVTGRDVVKFFLNPICNLSTVFCQIGRKIAK